MSERTHTLRADMSERTHALRADMSEESENKVKIYLFGSKH